jgi:uncharacterized protein
MAVSGPPGSAEAEPKAPDIITLKTIDGRVISSRVHVARSFMARFRGLMGRAQLSGDEGLYLPGDSSIHMLFMRFPIDCVFLAKPAADGTQRVVAVRHRLLPWRGLVWPVRGAAGVVELPAGTVERHRLAAGDHVRLSAGGQPPEAA